MVQRAILSKTIVDSFEAPMRGEAWIADTKLRGFGLRVWRSPSGAPKAAFSVRTTTSEGRSIRRAVPAWTCRSRHRDQHHDLYWEDPLYEPSLGELTTIAREVARDIIDVLKERPTLREEDDAEKRRTQLRVGNYTFGKAASVVIEGLRRAGRSKRYCDRLDKLFFTHVSKELRTKALVRVTKRDVARVLSRRSLSVGNMRVLRPLIGRCLDLPDRVGIRGKFRTWQLRKLEIHGRRPNENIWPESRVAEFRSYLRAHEYWQQAACMEVYLETGIPLAVLRRAKAEDIYDVKYRRHDQEWTAVELHLGNSRKHRARIDAPILDLLMTCNERCLEEFEESSYLFPSPVKARIDHIKSCDHVWNDARTKFRLGEMTLGAFRRMWFDATQLERSRRIMKWRLELRGRPEASLSKPPESLPKAP